MLGDTKDTLITGTLPDSASLPQEVDCATDLVGAQLEASQLMVCPRQGGRVEGFLCRAECHVQRIHEVNPAEHEYKQRGQGLCQPDCVFVSTLPIEALEQSDHRVYFRLEQLGLKHFSLRERAK